jgi:hypothetical protein
VTAEKKVATVDRFRRFMAPCFWANRIVGTPVLDSEREFVHILSETCVGMGNKR